MLLWALEYRELFEIAFTYFSDIYPGVELLGYIIYLFLDFWDTSILENSHFEVHSETTLQMFSLSLHSFSFLPFFHEVNSGLKIGLYLFSYVILSKTTIYSALAPPPQKEKNLDLNFKTICKILTHINYRFNFSSNRQKEWIEFTNWGQDFCQIFLLCFGKQEKHLPLQRGGLLAQEDNKFWPNI